MTTGWSQIWMDLQALFAHEAMETQVALGLALAIIFIMFFEGVWAVFRLPRKAVFSLFRPLSAIHSESAPSDLVYAAPSSAGVPAGVKAKNSLVMRNRKRTKSVNRRRSKPTKPVILKNTRIEPWLLADSERESVAPLELELESMAPLRHPDAV